MKARDSEIAAAFRMACAEELEAPKPGNVHIYASGHDMTCEDFLRSAAAAAPEIARTGARVGARILNAIEATRRSVRCNTNLGIVLLCAPLASAAERPCTPLREAVGHVLAGLDRDDAERAFRAIVIAAPGGLGRSERHDVAEPARVTLREAMQEASDRDRIALQYATDFRDIFELGLPLLRAWRGRGQAPWIATLGVYLGFLAAFPDSHIGRKQGRAAAAAVQKDATVLFAHLKSAVDPAACLAPILEFDARLKAGGLNPGTSADLTVATLFAHRLGCLGLGRLDVVGS